jgi:nickel-dependent lactate racemase
MRISLGVGRERLALDVAGDRLLASRAAPAALPDPAAALRAALDAPHGFPALRCALLPEDHVAVVVDEGLPGVAGLLVPLLEHITSAGVDPAALTLLLPPSADRHTWIDDLPEYLEEVHVEVHDPKDRRRLAYLATTAAGRRLYINRTLVDADQVVVLTERRYDLLLGYGGAEGALYPPLADEATRNELAGRLPAPAAGANDPWPVRREAAEVVWLLGQPFFVQCIAGVGDGIARVIAGAGDACREAERLLDKDWRQVVPEPADVVVASLSGDPSRHTFAELAAALASAAGVVRPEGRVVLLSAARPTLPPGAEVLRQHDEPQDALKELEAQPTLENAPAIRWAQAACKARLSVLSGWEDDRTEELYATPLAGPAEAQRLVDAGRACLFLEDAHRVLAVPG